MAFGRGYYATEEGQAEEGLLLREISLKEGAKP